MPFALREELWHFGAITDDMKLLHRENIETVADLSALKESHEENIALLIKERKRLQAKDHSQGSSSPKLNTRIAEINEALKALRKEVRQVKRIAERSGVLAERLALIEPEAEDKRRREVAKHGRNRAGNRATHQDGAPRF